MSDIFYNEFLAMCSNAASAYMAMCGTDPDCPKPVVPEPRKVHICGADITGYMASALIDVYNGRVLPDRNSEVDFKDYAGGKGTTRDCPTMHCFGTVTLCGRCVSNQLPGNIALGATAGHIGATIIGQGFQTARWLVEDNAAFWDAPDDRAGYRIGNRVEEAIDALGKDRPSPKDAENTAAVRSAMCAALQTEIDAGIVGTRNDCEACGSSWRPRGIPPRRSQWPPRKRRGGPGFTVWF